MVNIWTHVKPILKFFFLRSIFYNSYARFKFLGLPMKPSGLKARYAAFPWKKNFKGTWFYIPADPKKLYFFWFSVKWFYTSPTKRFEPPSLMMQKYFPNYDVLQDKETIRAWQWINAHFYRRWQRELYWYKMRARFSYEKHHSFFGMGFFPHYIFDKSLQRRPLRHKHTPPYELLQIYDAMDLLLYRLPSKKNWEKTLKKKQERNQIWFWRVDMATFWLHLIFYYPWKILYELYIRYLEFYVHTLFTIIIRYLLFGWKIWKGNKQHRIHGFMHWCIRSLVCFCTFTVPTGLFTAFIQELEIFPHLSEPITHQILGIRSNIEFYSVEHDEYLARLIGAPQGFFFLMNIILFIINIIISFSPHMWAWMYAFGDKLFAAISFFWYILCKEYIGCYFRMSWWYDHMPFAGAFVFSLGWNIYAEEFLTFGDEEATMPVFDPVEPKVVDGTLKHVVNPISDSLETLYENPDWKSTGAILYQSAMVRDIGEGERHLAAHLDAFWKASLNYKLAFWRRRHRYLRFFAEKWIEKQNLTEKDPQKFLEDWVTGLYTFWDEKMDNASNLYEWEHYANKYEADHKKQHFSQTFTEEKKAYFKKHYGDFWDFFIYNVTKVNSVDKQRESNLSWSHEISSFDGEFLGHPKYLEPLYNNKDLDVLHTMYFDSFRLQQAVFNEDLLVSWEKCKLIYTQVWSKDDLMREYVMRGFDETHAGGTFEEHNVNYQHIKRDDEMTHGEFADEDRYPAYGKGYDGLPLKPGFLVYDAKNMVVVSINDTPKKKGEESLWRYPFDRRIFWGFRPDHNPKADVSRWSMRAFYYVILKKWIKAFYNPIRLSFFEWWIKHRFNVLGDFIDCEIRHDVLMEMFVLKMKYNILPQYAVYKSKFFNNNTLEDIKNLEKQWKGYQAVHRNTSYKYIGEDWVSSHDKIVKEVAKHGKMWDRYFDKAIAETTILPDWEEFTKTDKAWNTFLTEKNFSDKTKEMADKLKTEMVLYERSCQLGTLSPEAQKRMLSMQALKWANLKSRRSHLQKLRIESDRYLFYTVHFDIVPRQRRLFLNRYHFFDIKATPKSALAKALVGKSLWGQFKDWIYYEEIPLDDFDQWEEKDLKNLDKKAEKDRLDDIEKEKYIASLQITEDETKEDEPLPWYKFKEKKARKKAQEAAFLEKNKEKFEFRQKKKKESIKIWEYWTFRYELGKKVESPWKRVADEKKRKERIKLEKEEKRKEAKLALGTQKKEENNEKETK